MATIAPHRVEVAQICQKDSSQAGSLTTPCGRNVNGHPAFPENGLKFCWRSWVVVMSAILVVTVYGSRRENLVTTLPVGAVMEAISVVTQLSQNLPQQRLKG